MRRETLGALAGLALGLLGCASPAPKGPAPDRVRLDVPLYRDARAPGTAALAEVLTFYNEPTEPKELAAELKEGPGPRRGGGTLPDGLLLAAQQRGMQARSFQADPGDVRQELSLGHPVLAYLRLGVGPWSGKRFVVITGFDDGRGGFFVHADGADQFVRYGAFMTRWEKTGRWAILVLPAGERAVSERSARSGL